MGSYIDVSLRILDPLDEYRLFEFPADAAAARATYQRVAPAGTDARCVLTAPTYYLLARGAQDMRAVNDFLLGERQAGGPVAAVFGVAEPKYDHHALQELERLAAQGAAGVIWSPRAQGVFGDDALLASLCRRAHELGLRSMVRAASYSSNEALWRAWRLARYCPDMPILVSGALQNWDNAQSIAAAEGAPENIVYDTAGWTTSTDPARLLDVVGQARLLFGTAGLCCADHAAAELERRLRQAGVSDAAVEAVMWGNAARLLGLEPPK